MPRQSGSLRHVPIDRCRLLSRNPQYLTAAQMGALARSVRRDGFLVPIVVRPIRGGDYEVVSGNHRLLAAREVGMRTVPAVCVSLKDDAAKRVALNLNTIHGELEAASLAPFLADMPDEILSEVHLSDALVSELRGFDRELSERLAELMPPEIVNGETPDRLKTCTCATCGNAHVPVRRAATAKRGGRPR